MPHPSGPQRNTHQYTYQAIMATKAGVPKEIIPMVAQAQNEMMALTRQDVVSLCSMKSPPDVIKSLMQTMLLLLGRKIENLTTWEDMKKEVSIISGRSSWRFHKILLGLTFRLHKVKSKAVWRVVNGRFKDPAFHPLVVRSASLEAGHLCEWLCAVASYRRMERVIQRETGCPHLPNYRELAPAPFSSTPASASTSFASSPSHSPPRKANSPRKAKSSTPRKAPLLSAEDFMEAAMPTLLQARRAQDALTAQDILELRSYKAPPLVVRQVLYSIMTLFGLGREERTWQKARDFMAGEDNAFLRRLEDRSSRGCKPRFMVRYRAYVRAREIDAVLVRNASLAAGRLCEWAQSFAKVVKVHAEYIKLYKTSPKKKRGPVTA